ncbi:hypothetical protein [Ruegeria atlantica]|uniref:Uncharacterized protein n=1 Tax=Ruegeria atlantica TaxID=81569 RepID=A0A0P1E9L3_9RHOB|nr:hypothetical protein [Ruegeria atlantica]CUH45952.1 hypothetical protein RUA4292_00115 [Ruegeria atlantica]
MTPSPHRMNTELYQLMKTIRHYAEVIGDDYLKDLVDTGSDSLLDLQTHLSDLPDLPL